MSARKATKLLHPRPCKGTVVHALKELDPFARIHFCNRFLQSVHDAEVDLDLLFLVRFLVFRYAQR
jgi:hypothetical protein